MPKGSNAFMGAVVVVAVVNLVASVGPLSADVWVPQVLPYALTIDGGLGFALDSVGHAGVTFQKTGGGLYYGYYSAGAWSTAQAVAAGTQTGRASALTYQGTIPHISYRDSDDTVNDVGSLVHATKSGASWSLATVDDAANTNPRHTAIALDTSNNPAIAYVDQHGSGTVNDTIDYAYYDGTDWYIEQIGSDVPLVLGGTDLAVPGANTSAQVVYSDGSGWYLPPVHATRSASWTLDTGLGGTADYEYAAYMALDLDSSGNPVIAFLDTGTDNVRYAEYNGSSWSIETAMSGGAGTAYNDYRYLDMALDSQNNPHIVYYDYVNSKLNYTFRYQDTWHLSHTWDIDAYWLGLTIDGSDAPQFVFYDDSDGNAYMIEGTPIPEPATLVLFGLGLLGLGAKLRNRRSTV